MLKGFQLKFSMSIILNTGGISLNFGRGCGIRMGGWMGMRSTRMCGGGIQGVAWLSAGCLTPQQESCHPLNPVNRSCLARPCILILHCSLSCSLYWTLSLVLLQAWVRRAYHKKISQGCISICKIVVNVLTSVLSPISKCISVKFNRQIVSFV